MTEFVKDKKTLTLLVFSLYIDITLTSPYKRYPRFASSIIVKTGEIWVWYSKIKSYFSIKSYVVAIY